MIRPIHGLLLAALLLGCQEQTISSQQQFLGGDGGDDMADLGAPDIAAAEDLSSTMIPPPPDLARTVTPRLRPRYVYNNSAVVGTVPGFYDTTLSTTCTPLMTKEGVVRCIPDGMLAETTDLPRYWETTWIDASCSKPILTQLITVYGPECCLPDKMAGKFLHMLTNPNEESCTSINERRIDSVFKVGGAAAAPSALYYFEYTCKKLPTAFYADFVAHHRFFTLTDIPLRSLAEITEP